LLIKYFLNKEGNNLRTIYLRGTSLLEQANKAFATPFRRTACGPRMANAILKITVFRRNIRMGRINRQDPILLKYDNSYLIEKNLRIFYLISKIFPNENLNYEIPGLDISSNESFGFLKEDKEQYLNKDNNEDLNIPLNNIIIENQNEENQNEQNEEDAVNFISTILDDQLNISVSNNQFESSISSTTYQTSSNFLQLRTNIYPTTKNFNNAEHNVLKELYKNEFLGKITNIINIIDWNYIKTYWDDKVDNNAESNSTDKIRPKSIENLKEHLLVLENYYLRKQIESNTLTGYYYFKL